MDAITELEWRRRTEAARRKQMDTGHRARTPGYSDYARDAVKDVATVETLSSMGFPVISDAADAALATDAARRGNWGEAALYGAALALPFVSGPALKTGFDVVGRKLGKVGDVPYDPNAVGAAAYGNALPGRGQSSVVWREGATDDLALAYMDAQEKLAAHPEYRRLLANPNLKPEARKDMEKLIAEKLGITGVDLGELSAAEKKALTARVRSQYPTAPPYRVADDVPLKVRKEDVVHQTDRHLLEGNDGSIFNSAEEAAQAIEQTLASRRGYAPHIENKPGAYMRLQQKPDAPKRGAAIGVLEPGVGEAYLRTAFPRWK